MCSSDLFPSHDTLFGKQLQKEHGNIYKGKEGTSGGVMSKSELDEPDLIMERLTDTTLRQRAWMKEQGIDVDKIYGQNPTQTKPSRLHWEPINSCITRT